MTLTGLIIVLVALVLVVSVAFWLIEHLQEPLRMRATTIVVLIALIVLVGYVWPSILNICVGR
jgi:uncharacterized membrane protein (UPF0182 family)